MFIINSYRFPPSFSNLKSMNFDGVDEWVDCGIVTEFSGSTEMSLSIWCYHSSYSTPHHQAGYYTAAGAAFRIYTSGTRPAFVIDGSNSILAQFNILPFNEWFHMTYVFNGDLVGHTNRMKMYLNGAQINNVTSGGTAPSSLAVPTASFGIGGLNSTLNSLGIHDEVAIFDYALTGSEITDIYNSGSAPDLNNIPDLVDPIHWWRMGDGGDTISLINDIGSIGGNDGTPINMQTSSIVTNVP